MACLASMRRARGVQARKVRQQRVKELEELSECTFRPSLVSQQLAGSGKAIKMACSLPAPRAALAAQDGNLFDCSGRPVAIEEARCDSAAEPPPQGAHLLASCLRRVQALRTQRAHGVPFTWPPSLRLRSAGSARQSSTSLFDLAKVADGPEQLYEVEEVQKLLAATALTSAAVSASFDAVAAMQR